YLRMAGDSEIVFQFDDSSRQELTVDRGSIIVEASIDTWITVNTPKRTVYLIRPGVYRLSVNADRLDVAVREGKAFVGDSEVKDGRRATFTAKEAVIAKFDKACEDAFDVWSRDRAKSLVALNRSLDRSQLRRSGLISSINNAWIYDSFCGCYTFLPWTGGFASPYGWGYSVCNPYWYARPWYSWFGGGVGVGGGGRWTPAPGAGANRPGGSGGSGGGHHGGYPGGGHDGGNPGGGHNGGNPGGGHNGGSAPPPSSHPSLPSMGDGGKLGGGGSAPSPVNPGKHSHSLKHLSQPTCPPPGPPRPHP